MSTANLEHIKFMSANGIPTGHVIQTAYTSTISSIVDNSIGGGSHVDLMTSDAFTTTGSNKVLVFLTIIFGECNNVGYGLKRNGSFVGGVGGTLQTYHHPDWLHGSDNYLYTGTMDVYSTLEQSIVYMDSPSAGTHTYTMCAIASNTTGTMNFGRADYATNYGTGRSSITLMEIKV